MRNLRCSFWLSLLARPLANGAVGRLFSTLVMASVLLPVSPVLAKGAKTCAGVDMLVQMRKAAPNAYAQTMAKARTPNDGAIFWRISKGDARPSYLLGTLHLSDPRIVNLSPTITAGLEGASVVALEIEDLSPLAAARAITGAAELVVFSGGKRLTDLLSVEEFERVEKTLSKIGIPAQMAPLLKPWVVSLLTAVSECERKRVAGGKLVLDMKLAAIARERGIPVVGLETLHSQLQAAAAVPLSEQVQALRTGIYFGDRANDLMETVIGLYIRRKIGAAIPFETYLASSAGIGSMSLKGFQRELIVARNRKMRTRILPLLGGGGAFVAVGALHLVGETGLVALLRKAGYDVVPVE